jgi:hypothetical protein
MRICFVVVVGVLLGTAGCKKKTTPTSNPTEQPPPATAPAGGGNTNYVPGAGLQNIRQAGRRLVRDNDLKQIGLLITQWEIENNRMPNVSEIKSLLASAPNLKELIDTGSVILTGTTERSGLWAYEIEADVKGGLGLVAGVPNRYSADDIKQMLGR